MDYLIKFSAGKNAAQSFRFGDVVMNEPEIFPESQQFADVALFEFRVVKIVQIIKRMNAMTVAQEPFANVRADEARAAGDQKIHGRTLTTQSETVERAGYGGRANRPAFSF